MITSKHIINSYIRIDVFSIVSYNNFKIKTVIHCHFHPSISSPGLFSLKLHVKIYMDFDDSTSNTKLCSPKCTLLGGLEWRKYNISMGIWSLSICHSFWVYMIMFANCFIYTLYYLNNFSQIIETRTLWQLFGVKRHIYIYIYIYIYICTIFTSYICAGVFTLTYVTVDTMWLHIANFD